MNIPGRCPKCQEIMWTSAGVHRCAPEFHVIAPDHDGYDTPEEGPAIYAHSHEEAAEKWAERWDVDDHQMLDDEVIEVLVKDSAGVVRHFRVSGEAVPSYHAREYTPEAKPDAA